MNPKQLQQQSEAVPEPPEDTLLQLMERYQHLLVLGQLRCYGAHGAGLSSMPSKEKPAVCPHQPQLSAEALLPSPSQPHVQAARARGAF